MLLVASRRSTNLSRFSASARRGSNKFSCSMGLLHADSSVALSLPGILAPMALNSASNSFESPSMPFKSS